MEIYLDNSATTPMSANALKAMTDTAQNVYGNPSSLHKPGIRAERVLDASRAAAARLIGASESSVDKEIIFTSGGTEANNLAVFGAAHARRRRGNKIVTTMIEHSSVLESCKALENEGFTVVYLKPDSEGHILKRDLVSAIDENTILVTMMYVNNELGTILPVDYVKSVIKAKNSPALFHIDAVQALGKLPIKVQQLGCDLMSVSAHKIHGPKGCGALYVKKGTHIVPLLYGGEQEKKIRPGTEALPLIAAFAAAAGECGDIQNKAAKAESLRRALLTNLSDTDGIIVNSPEDGLAYIVNISTSYFRSETMIHYLESEGIYVSSGSACAKGRKSHVLSAAGLSDRRIDTALRISFSHTNTLEEAAAFAEALKRGMSTLVRAY